jgi:hypothetical protein
MAKAPSPLPLFADGLDGTKKTQFSALRKLAVCPILKWAIAHPAAAWL